MALCLFDVEILIDINTDSSTLVYSFQFVVWIWWAGTVHTSEMKFPIPSPLIPFPWLIQRLSSIFMYMCLYTLGTCVGLIFRVVNSAMDSSITKIQHKNYDWIMETVMESLEFKSCRKCTYDEFYIRAPLDTNFFGNLNLKNLEPH